MIKSIGKQENDGGIEMKNRVFIKGFDKDLKCRGYQFEVGKEYKIDLPDGHQLTQEDLCSNKVFHFCDSLSKVDRFYFCNNENNRYCIIEVLGQFCENEDKCGSNHIRIVKEISGEELEIAKGMTDGNTGLFNSGKKNTGNKNSGDRNSGTKNNGDYNSGHCNSGHYNSGDYNNGNYNSGDHNNGQNNSGRCNSGYYNSGNNNIGNANCGSYNIGHRNSGICNSGDYNSGNNNIGHYNCGDYNSGQCNSGDYNNGRCNSGIFNKTNNSNDVFCNKEPKIRIFNIQTDWTLIEFYKSKYYKALYSSNFPLTECVNEKLEVNTYEEACRRWWQGMTKENKEIIKSIPNFDIDVFCDITGIDKTEVEK